MIFTWPSAILQASFSGQLITALGSMSIDLHSRVDNTVKHIIFSSLNFHEITIFPIFFHLVWTYFCR